MESDRVERAASKDSMNSGWSRAGDPNLANSNRRLHPKFLPATTFVACKAESLWPNDEVQVWSNSLRTWLEARVMVVFKEACVADGYSVAAGTVKVTSESGVKWVYPENVHKHLRKVDVETRPEPAPGSVTRGGSSSSSAPLCKNGCGRCVQPGLTRGLKPYDTCCKSCASAPGKNKHDENCGGMAPPPSADKAGPSSKITVDPSCNLKKMLQKMLSDPKELSRHTATVFSNVGGGADRLTSSQVAQAIHSLIALFGVNLEVSEHYAKKVCGKYLDGDEKMGLQTFNGLCKMVLEDRQRLWFPEILPVSTQDFVKQNKMPLDKVYEIGAKLGEGSFGTVYRVVHRLSHEQRVCKKIAQSKSSLMSRQQILAEIANMAMLDHPNVIKVFEYFDDGQYVSQVMEECSGSELQDKIDVYRKTGTPPYDEPFVRDVVKQTLRALAFMHARRFMHKDLKPQNIMMVDNTGTSIKVIDFGLAELFNPTQKYAAFTGGTLLYMAPEVFRQEMTVKVDVWSAGVILFNLMTADFPFLAQWPPPPGKNEAWWQEATIEKIKNEEPQKHAGLDRFSPACVSLCVQMLDKDSNGRPDAATCLQREWFAEHEKSVEPPTLSIGVVQCVEAYARMGELKKAIFLLIAHQCKVDALNELRAIFTHFDVKNHGSLSTTDIRSVLIASGMGPLSAERVIHALDRDSDGQIMWTEFMAAAICVSVCRSQRCVDAAFATFDADQDGHISAEDIPRVLGSGLPAGCQEAWAQRLPQQISEVMAVAADPPGGHFGQSVKRWAMGLLSSSESSSKTITRYKFHAYVGQHLDFRAGDALYAVK